MRSVGRREGEIVGIGSSSEEASEVCLDTVVGNLREPSAKQKDAQVHLITIRSILKIEEYVFVVEVELS